MEPKVHSKAIEEMRDEVKGMLSQLLYLIVRPEIITRLSTISFSAILVT